MVIQAAAPLEALFFHSGAGDVRDRQLLDDLGLSGVRLSYLLSWSHLTCLTPLPGLTLPVLLLYLVSPYLSGQFFLL